MRLEKIILIMKMAAEKFQRLQLLEKVIIGCVFVMVAAVVLSHDQAALVFLSAVCGGGWATFQMTVHNSVLNSRRLLPFLPDLVAREKVKRPQAGLSVLPNFGGDVEKYSINGWKLTHRRREMEKMEKAEDRDRYLNLQSISSLPVPVTVDKELQYLVKSIMVEFILSWYSIHVSSHGQVSEEFRKHLLSISENLCTRLELVSKRRFVTHILVEFRTHVYRFHRARSSLRKLRSRRTMDSSSLVASYETFSLMHSATEDTTTEMDYLKGIMRIVLDCAVPRSVTRCKASTAILIDIITCNLLLPLLNLLADPDFLYRLILLIISSAVSLEAPQSEHATSSEPETPAPVTSIPKSGLHQEGIEASSQSNSEHSPVSPSSKGNGIQQPDTPQESSVHVIFEPRNPPNFQQDQAQTYPLFQQTKHSKLTKVPNEASFPSPSRDRISRSVEALVDNSYPNVTHGRNSNVNLLSDCAISTALGSRRRTASDSSLNPALCAFIPGDVPVCQIGGRSIPGCTNPVDKSSVPGVVSPVDGAPPVYGENPAEGCNVPGNLENFEDPIHVEPRKPTDVRENTDKVVVPMTALAPGMTNMTKAGRYRNPLDDRPRSWSENLCSVVSSISFDISSGNMPLTDTDYQFAFEGGPTAPASLSAATNTVNASIRDKRDNPSGSGLRHVVDDTCAESDDKLQREGTSTNLHRTSNVDSEHLQCPVETNLSSDKQVIPPVAGAVPSSPIQKLLRRVSLSKKGKSGSPRSETSASRNPAVSTSQPVSIPISARLSRMLPSERDQSPPTLPQVNSVIGFSDDDTQIPTADDPKVVSGSAPETVGSVSVMGAGNSLAKWKVMNLTIPVTEVCKDIGGKGEFFLYSIQFDVLVLSTASSTENSQECGTTTVHKTTKRRHREFVNLHSRLDHNLRLKQSLKGIRDVPRRLSIPLAPTAKAAIEQRRISHQHYLQQLLAKPLLHASAELAAFLALEGDTHIEYVRHQPREYVPRIDKLLRNRVSGLVDSFKSALPRALSDLGPLPPTSPSRKTRSSEDAGKRRVSPPGSPRLGSPAASDEQDGRADQERIFAFDRRPKTTLQLAMDSIIQDHSHAVEAQLTLSAHPTAATDPISHPVHSPSSDKNGREPPDAFRSENRPEGPKTSGSSESEEVALFDSVMCLLGEAFHDKEPWFIDEGFQSLLKTLAGGLLDGWIERQIDLLLSEHWCAFYLAELRELLWPDGQLLSGSEEAGTRSRADKEATRKEVLTSLVDLMPESFYSLVDKVEWQEGLQLLLDSLSDPHLNRHLVFMALDLLMDALVTEIKDESYQKDLLARI